MFLAAFFCYWLDSVLAYSNHDPFDMEFGFRVNCFFWKCTRNCNRLKLNLGSSLKQHSRLNMLLICLVQSMLLTMLKLSFTGTAHTHTIEIGIVL